MTEATEARRRDPDRRERILKAAAGLVVERSYHEVGMTDIGAAAGITGSAIYRHFDGKSDVLATMFDRVIDDLSAGAARIAESDAQPIEALRALIRADQLECLIATAAELVLVGADHGLSCGGNG